ncbi:hypothetical protein Tco_0751048 [Tanacetum coccineum]|uniref:Uncharacterized protein n=1 Tax=Tanacetum coccineum TaxID=301880 RepID=A0ABQ4Z657_9ASTR
MDDVGDIGGRHSTGHFILGYDGLPLQPVDNVTRFHTRISRRIPGRSTRDDEKEVGTVRLSYGTGGDDGVDVDGDSSRDEANDVDEDEEE